MKKLLRTGLLSGMAFCLLHCAAGNQTRQSCPKDYNQTLALCKQALLADSTDTESLLLMAKAYVELDSLPRAENALERALCIEPADPGFRQEASNLYFQLAERTRKSSDVLRCLTKAEELSPESPEVLERLGALYEKAGKLEESKIRYDKLVMLVKNPTRYGFMANTLENKIQFAREACAEGLQLYENKKYDTAEIQLTKAVEVYPGMNEAVYYLNLSKSRIIQRNPNETARKQAREYLRIAFEAEPAKAEAHYLMAQSYEMEDDKDFLDEAMHHYSLSCKLEPKGPFAKKSNDKVKSLTNKKEFLDKFWNRGRNQ